MTKKEKKAMGDRLRALREGLNLTQEKVAEKVGVLDSKSISDYERGRHEARYETLIRLAIALHTTTDYILTGQRHLDDEPCDLSEEEKQILQEFDKLYERFRKQKTSE